MRAMAWFLALWTLLGTRAATAQDVLQYQFRGNRNEGVKAKPVSGYDIELLSARVDHQEDMSKLGASLAFQFFLKERAVVYPLVRELEARHSYILDNVQPPTPWTVGYANVFQWPTGEVVSRLNDLKPSDLGIVVRLGKSTPSVNEVVAPAMFYQPPVPREATGYSFTFMLRDDGAVTATIFREAEDREVFRQRFARLSGGHPFTVKWPSPPALQPAGRYRVVLSGYFLDTNKPIQQTVTFYHQPPVVGQ